MLTEQEIARNWRSLFQGGKFGQDALDKAETLLDELRPESPLRHRLGAELVELKALAQQQE